MNNIILENSIEIRHGYDFFYSIFRRVAVYIILKYVPIYIYIVILLQ